MMEHGKSRHVRDYKHVVARSLICFSGNGTTEYIQSQIINQLIKI